MTSGPESSKNPYPDNHPHRWREHFVQPSLVLDQSFFPKSASTGSGIVGSDQARSGTRRLLACLGELSPRPFIQQEVLKQVSQQAVQRASTYSLNQMSSPSSVSQFVERVAELIELGKRVGLRDQASGIRFTRAALILSSKIADPFLVGASARALVQLGCAPSIFKECIHAFETALEGVPDGTGVQTARDLRRCTFATRLVFETSQLERVLSVDCHSCAQYPKTRASAVRGSQLLCSLIEGARQEAECVFAYSTACRYPDSLCDPARVFAYSIVTASERLCDLELYSEAVEVLSGGRGILQSRRDPLASVLRTELDIATAMAYSRWYRMFDEPRENHSADDICRNAEQAAKRAIQFFRHDLAQQGGALRDLDPLFRYGSAWAAAQAHFILIDLFEPSTCDSVPHVRNHLSIISDCANWATLASSSTREWPHHAALRSDEKAARARLSMLEERAARRAKESRDSLRQLRRKSREGDGDRLDYGDGATSD